MNENINLCEILKYCPNGWKFYSVVHGDVRFITLLDLNKILFGFKDGKYYFDIVLPSDGKLYKNGECIVFPSKDQRDWSKFTAPWYKREKFDPKTLQQFDRVIVKNILDNIWRIQYFSHIDRKCKKYPFICLNDCYTYCIPYNEDTKHLVGTRDEAPDFYKYWEK